MVYQIQHICAGCKMNWPAQICAAIVITCTHRKTSLSAHIHNNSPLHASYKNKTAEHQLQATTGNLPSDWDIPSSWHVQKLSPTQLNQLRYLRCIAELLVASRDMCSPRPRTGPGLWTGYEYNYCYCKVLMFQLPSEA